MPKSGGTFSGSVTFERSIQCDNIQCDNITSIDESYRFRIYTYHPGDVFDMLNGKCDITFTPDDVQIDASKDIILNTPSGNVYINNGLIIDTDKIYIQSIYGYKRLDSYIKNVVADSSVPK